MVGLQGFAQALQATFVGIHHIEGHLLAAKVDSPFSPAPIFGAIASGGHSALYDYRGLGDIALVGETRDDAAGEATYLKLGLGYPGGRIIDERAERGDPYKYALPVSLKQKRYWIIHFQD